MLRKLSIDLVYTYTCFYLIIFQYRLQKIELNFMDEPKQKETKSNLRRRRSETTFVLPRNILFYRSI